MSFTESDADSLASRRIWLDLHRSVWVLSKDARQSQRVPHAGATCNARTGSKTGRFKHHQLEMAWMQASSVFQPVFCGKSCTQSSPERLNCPLRSWYEIASPARSCWHKVKVTKQRSTQILSFQLQVLWGLQILQSWCTQHLLPSVGLIAQVQKEFLQFFSVVSAVLGDTWSTPRSAHCSNREQQDIVGTKSNSGSVLPNIYIYIYIYIQPSANSALN